MKKFAASILAFVILGVGSVYAKSYYSDQLDQLEQFDRSQRDIYGSWNGNQIGGGYSYRDNQGCYGELRSNQFGGGYTYKDNRGGYYELSPNPYTGGYDIRGH